MQTHNPLTVILAYAVCWLLAIIPASLLSAALGSVLYWLSDKPAPLYGIGIVSAFAWLVLWCVFAASAEWLCGLRKDLMNTPAQREEG